MAQCRPFRETGRPAGVLNVDRIVKFLISLHLLECFLADIIPHGKQFSPGQHTWNVVLANTNDRSEIGELLRLQLANFALREFRRQGLKHLSII